MNVKKAEGSVFHVLLFSLPVIISQACDSLMMLTDRYLLAQVNPIFAAAAMSGGMTAFLFWIFGAGLLGFVTPLTAQYMGANAPNKAKKVLVQALILSVILSVPLLLFSRSLGFYYFTFLRLPAEELPLTMAYLSVIIQCCFFVFVKVSFASFFSGIGKTKIVMTVNMSGLILNIPLSYFFIHGGWGEAWINVKGAALGTVCAELFMTLLYIGIFLKSYAKNMQWSFERTLFKKLLKYGFSTGMEFFVLTLAFNTFLTMFHSFGIDAAQAIAITSTWSWLTVLPFFGLSVGVMSLVGHSLGKNNSQLASQITLSAIKIAFAIVALASIGFLGFSDSLVHNFGIMSESPVYELAIFMIQMLPLYCIFDALNFVVPATLRASGDTFFCLKINAIGHWTCLLICFYGIYYGHFSPSTIWCLFILTLLIQSIIFGYRYLRGSWKSLKMAE